MTLDAGGCSAADDIKRLIFTAYIATRNVFSDAALASPGNKNASNALKDVGGEPLEGTGDIVIYSRETMTLRFELVVGVPAATAGIWMVVGLYWLWFRPKVGPGEGGGSSGEQELKDSWSVDSLQERYQD